MILAEGTCSFIFLVILTLTRDIGALCKRKLGLKWGTDFRGQV